MSARGFEPEESAGAPPWKPQVDTGEHIRGNDVLRDREPKPGRQKGAQRASKATSAGHRLADLWRERRVQHDWKILDNYLHSVTDFNRHLAKTGVSEETFAAMIEAWWADPGLVSRLDPARTAYKTFLYRDWKTVLARVERLAAVEYESDPTDETKTKGLLGLE